VLPCAYDLGVPAALAVAVTLIILPVIIARAQSDGAVGESDPEEPTVHEESAGADVGEAALATAPPHGDVHGEPDAVADEGTASAAAPVLAENEPLMVPAVASSTHEVGSEATSTEPVEPLPETPKEEPFVLQPGVELSINGNTVSAAITLENLTCRSYDKVLPELEVLTYYTPWYPNDGPVSEYSDANVHGGKHARSVADLPNGAARELTWSGEIPPGRYYFVVEIDPDNAQGGYQLFRSEFAI
jgi:hypothetical protein